MHELFEAITEGFIKASRVAGKVNQMTEFEARMEEWAQEEADAREDWRAWQEEKNLEFYEAREIDWKIDEIEERGAF